MSVASIDRLALIQCLRYKQSKGRPLVGHILEVGNSNGSENFFSNVVSAVFDDSMITGVVRALEHTYIETAHLFVWATKYRRDLRVSKNINRDEALAIAQHILLHDPTLMLEKTIADSADIFDPDKTGDFRELVADWYYINRDATDRLSVLLAYPPGLWCVLTHLTPADQVKLLTECYDKTGSGFTELIYGTAKDYLSNRQIKKLIPKLLYISTKRPLRYSDLLHLCRTFNVHRKLIVSNNYRVLRRLVQQLPQFELDDDRRIYTRFYSDRDKYGNPECLPRVIGWLCDEYRMWVVLARWVDRIPMPICLDVIPPELTTDVERAKYLINF